MQSSLLTAFDNNSGKYLLIWEERMYLNELNAIIVKANSSTYVGWGPEM